MATFSIITLPYPAPDHKTLVEYSSRLKALRLKSLKQNPESFISVYESEADQPQDFWLRRLSGPRASHQVVVRNNPDPTALDENSRLMQGEWMGFVVTIAPDWDAAEDSSHEPPQYFMSAVYVEPESRSLGLGKQLVQATLATVKKDSTAKGKASACCNTTVRHGNDRAQALYEKMGFQVVDPNKGFEKDGKIYTATTLRIDV